MPGTPARARASGGLLLVLVLALLAPAAGAAPLRWQLDGVFESGAAAPPGTPFRITLSFDSDQAEAGLLLAGSIVYVFATPFELRLEYGGTALSSLASGDFTLGGGYCYGSIGFGFPSCNEIQAQSGSFRTPDPMPFGFELRGPLGSFLPPWEGSHWSDWIPTSPPDPATLPIARAFILDPSDPDSPPLAEGSVQSAARVPEPRRAAPLATACLLVSGLAARSRTRRSFHASASC